MIERERALFAERHPRSRELHERARGSLLAGVPMSWMTMWPGGHPVYLAEADAARLVDVDGNEYADFCLGDTGAMAGHSPEPTMRAMRERSGLTTMLPTEDAAWVGEELARRFGLPEAQVDRHTAVFGDAVASLVRHGHVGPAGVAPARDRGV